MQNIEEMLKDYYKNQKRIEYLKGRYDVLMNNIREIERCISETQHTLEVALPSQRYDKERVSTSGTPINPQEQALLDSEERMKRKIHELKSDQFDCFMEQLDIEGECQITEKLIQSLEAEEITICELKFRKRKSLAYIGNQICTDRTTVSRKLKHIYEKISRELGLSA